LIGRRSSEYQGLRRACRIDTGTSTPRIDEPCADRRWNRQYYTWRHLFHVLAVVLALHSPCPPKPAATGTRIHGWCVSCPARLGCHSSGRGASLLSCGDVEANPGPPPPDWGKEDYAVLPDLVQEACYRLGIAPVRDAFATPNNRRLPAFWTKAEDAFSQAWDYPGAGALWARSPFSRLDEVVTKASRQGCLMLVIAPEWSGPGYPWWKALCALCPKRWCFPEGRPVYLRGGTDLVPAPRWRTWAFLLDSRPPQQLGLAPPPPTVALAVTPAGPSPPRVAPLDQDPGAQLMAAHRHTETLPLGSRPGKSDKRRGVQRFDPTSGARPRPHSLGPPLAGPFLPRPVRQATTLTHIRTMADPMDAAQGSGPTVGSNLRPGCRVEAVPPPSAPPLWTRTLCALRSVLRLPPHQSRCPHLTHRSRPPRWAPRRSSWRQTPSHHKGPHLMIPLGECPPGRNPWK